MPPTNFNFKGLAMKIWIEKGTADEIEWEHNVIKFTSPLTAIDLQDRAIDLIGTNDGTWTGTEAYTTGKYGRAADLDGSSYITLDNEANFDFEYTDPFSLSFWMKQTSAEGGGNDILIAKQLNTGTFRGWNIFITTTGFFRFTIANDFGGGNYIQTSVIGQSAIDDGKWHHIVATWAGNASPTVADMTWYIDGVVFSTGTVVDNLSATILTNESVGIGARGGTGGLPYTGKMQFVNIYDIELTQAQVTDLFNAQNPYGSVSKTTAAVQDFDFEEGSLEVGVSGNHGAFSFTFDDTAKTFLDTTSLERRSTIKRTWNFEVWLGKKPADAYRALKGNIQSATPIFPSTGVIKQRVFGIGSKEILSTRYTTMKRYQKKLDGDADALDTTDTSTRISELAKDLLSDTDHYANTGATPLTFTTNLIETIAISLPSSSTTSITNGSVIVPVSFARNGASVDTLSASGINSHAIQLACGSSAEFADSCFWSALIRLYPIP